MTHADLTDRLDHNWRVIDFELRRPDLSRSERFLRRLGLPSHVTRVAAATPALRRRWLIAMAVAVFIGLAAGDPATPRASLYVWLVLAPLVPVLGVSLAFGPEADPAYDVAVSTPMRGLRLMAVRTAVVLAVSMPVLAVGSLLSPVVSLIAFAWFVPSLALSLASLALMTVTSPNRAATAAAAAWILGTIIVRRVADDPLTAFGPVAQLVCAVIAVCGLVVLLARRSSFDLGVWAGAT